MEIIMLTHTDDLGMIGEENQITIEIKLLDSKMSLKPNDIRDITIKKNTTYFFSNYYYMI